MLLWSIQDIQKESSCVDTCYQNSVSTALVSPMSHSKTRRKFWKAVTQHKSIQSSEEDSSSCLVCQFPKQRLMLLFTISVLLMMRYWRCSVQLAIPLEFAWFSFGTGHIVSSHFRVRHWSDAVENLLWYSFSHSMVLTELNMWCANLLDNNYDNMSILISSFLINHNWL